MKWEAPPPKGLSSLEILETIAELQASPGNWARVEDNAATRNYAAKWKNRGCEAVTRPNKDGTFNIWARWPKRGK